MRSVVVLALLLQTAVVFGLGAIHAPNNNNRATTSTLPWVGMEAWSTAKNGSIADQIFTEAGVLYVYGHTSNDCTERLLTLGMEDGIETSSASLSSCDFNAYTTSFAQQLPFVATLSKSSSVNVYTVSSSSVTPIMSLPGSSAFSAIFSVADHFFWFATGPTTTSVTTLTKIDPRARTSTTSNSHGTAGFVAGLNHLFAIGRSVGHFRDNHTVYCYSAATGDVIWTVSLPVGVKLVPAPSSDTVLFVLANYSTSLFNSATGEWIWTANVAANSAVNGASVTAVFATNTVIFNMNVEMGPTNTTAVDVTSGKILWKVVGGANHVPSYSCVLKSNIFVALANIGSFDVPKYSLIGFDVKTGNKVLDYTPTFTRSTDTDYRHGVISVHAHNDDVYFVVQGNPRQQQFDPYAVFQRITFAPRP